MAFRLEIADFGDFYERTYQAAYRTALGIVRDPALAADVTQDAYVAAYRNRDRFRGDAPSGVWLHRIIVNEALAAHRRRKPTQSVTDITPLIATDGTVDAVGHLSLLAALDDLPARHRAALVLRYYHDYDYATIGRILGTTTSNVGVLLARGRDRLKVALEHEPGASADRGGQP